MHLRLEKRFSFFLALYLIKRNSGKLSLTGIVCLNYVLFQYIFSLVFLSLKSGYTLECFYKS